MANRIVDILDKADPLSTAILAMDVAPMSFGTLRKLATYVALKLNCNGISRNDRVAIVLPNGPHMATAFLTVASSASAAPLNPSLRAAEFEAYLTEMDACAIILPIESGGEARDVATRLKIKIFDLEASLDVAGQFTLHAEPQPVEEQSQPVFANKDDIALILHTSGTTGRPKIVPLSHGNLVASALNIGTTLKLGREDVCLNIMPLFHIHGLVGAVLSSMISEAAVACTPGFNAFHVMAWLDEFHPTWITAVPTMLYSLLGVAARETAVIKRGRLRFIRSSSASLPQYVSTELERIFDVPVIEAYGMTEASHQVASNPLPPARRVTGSVGLPAGPEVAALDSEGNPLPAGIPGEVGIRGPNVFFGYENADDTNTKAFHNGWFLTGDQGIIDGDGYLFLTGRLKEMINRGGEKVAPFEVDTVLLSHPYVAEAVTFAAPHKLLGEEVAAAIVVRDNATVTDDELIEFVGQKLAQFKVPSRFVFLDDIPKGDTGKLMRVGLAEKLGLCQGGDANATLQGRKIQAKATVLRKDRAAAEPSKGYR